MALRSFCIMLAECVHPLRKKGGMDMSVWGKLRGKADRVREAMMEYAYLITLGTVVAVIAASAMYANSVRTQFEEKTDTPVEAAAEAPEIAKTPEPTPAERPMLTPLPTLAPLMVSTLGTGAGRMWPVSGEVVRGYAPDNLVFWETLSCWKAHPGVDIAAVAGEGVLCVMDGVVEDVARDDLWGYRVRVAQTDGSIAEYAGIAVCLLKTGQSITRGQTVGTLMEAIPCEAELGAHLHLEITKDGEKSDPQAVLKNARRK